MEYKVSVVLPVYNVENFIEEALHSVVKQTLKEIEFIFVDDCSQDGSVKIIQKAMEQDSRIKLIQLEENRGEVVAKHIGVQAAQANYIGTLDPDDFILPEMYEVMYAEAIKSNVDCVVSQYKICDEQGKFLNFTHEIPIKFSTNELDKNNIAFLNPASTNKLIKKDICLRAFDFEDRDVWKDLYQFWRAFGVGPVKVSILESALYNYRIRAGSITHSPIAEDVKAKQFIKTIRLILEYLIQLDSYEYYENIFWHHIAMKAQTFRENKKKLLNDELIKIFFEYNISKKHLPKIVNDNKMLFMLFEYCRKAKVFTQNKLSI